jgi:hypothetical protein
MRSSRKTRPSSGRSTPELSSPVEAVGSLVPMGAQPQRATSGRGDAAREVSVWFQRPALEPLARTLSVLRIPPHSGQSHTSADRRRLCTPPRIMGAMSHLRVPVSPLHRISPSPGHIAGRNTGRYLRSRSATASMCGVWGKRSTGWMRRGRYRSRRILRSRARVAGLHDT